MWQWLLPLDRSLSITLSYVIKVSLCCCNFCSSYIKLYFLLFVFIRITHIDLVFIRITHINLLFPHFIVLFVLTPFLSVSFDQRKVFFLITKFINQGFFHKFEKKGSDLFYSSRHQCLLLYLKKIILNC